jgi:GTPase
MDDIDIIYDKLYIKDENKLIPESEETNIEYKLRIDLKSKESKDNMISQMLYRMNIGKNLYGDYIAHYVMGVMDDGTFPVKELKIKSKTFKKMFNIFQKLCDRANCDIIDYQKYIFPDNHNILYFKIQKNHQIKSLNEFNMILYGANYVGKSSLMSRLCYGQIDDGNGFSRKLVLRHPHEKYSGSTKSNTYDCFGFSDDNLINYSMGVDFTLENIYKASDKIINVIDITASKNIKNTIHGLTSNILNRKNNLIFILIDSDIKKCLNDNIRLYQNIKDMCDIIKIEPIVIINKIDLLDNIDDINEDIITDFFGDIEILKLSNVSDYGFDILINKISGITKYYEDQNFKNNLFAVNSVFTIPDIGNIYHGKLLNGILKIGTEVGIYCNGIKRKKTIKSIQKKTMSVKELNKGESGCITFKNHIAKNKMSKTSIISNNIDEINFVNEINIDPLNKNISLQQYMAFIGNQIVIVNLCKEKESYIIKILDDKKINIFTNFIVLKDEKQKLEFCNIL